MKEKKTKMKEISRFVINGRKYITVQYKGNVHVRPMCEYELFMRMEKDYRRNGVDK